MLCCFSAAGTSFHPGWLFEDDVWPEQPVGGGGEIGGRCFQNGSQCGKLIVADDRPCAAGAKLAKLTGPAWQRYTKRPTAKLVGRGLGVDPADSPPDLAQGGVELRLADIPCPEVLDKGVPGQGCRDSGVGMLSL